MKTKQWFQVCKPNPTPEQACVQVGVHIEEFAEMLGALGLETWEDSLSELSDFFKEHGDDAMFFVNNADHVSLLDSMIDQNVTGQGVCHTLGFDFDGALAEVERSNASKLVDGKPIFDKNGKIDKPESYSSPNLSKFV